MSKATFWKRIFRIRANRSAASLEQPSSISDVTPPAAPKTPAVVCTTCGVSYNIGQDSVIVTSESAFALTPKAIIFTTDSNIRHEDMLSKRLDVEPEALAKVRENAIKTWQEVTAMKNEQQRRVWRCNACSGLNAYRINGKTLFFGNRLSEFLSSKRLKSADGFLRMVPESMQAPIAAMRLAEGILHGIILTRLSRSKSLPLGDDMLCDYRRAIDEQDVGFLAVREAFRADIQAEWAATLKERGQNERGLNNIDRLYEVGQITDLFDNALFAIGGRVPDYFLIENWNSAGVIQIVPVVPEVNYEKINWELLLLDDSGFRARARMLMAHLTKLSHQGKIEVFLKNRTMDNIEEIMYLAAVS